MYPGMTGLLITNSPFTVPKRTIEIALAGLSENSDIPNYTFTELPSITITTGVTPDIELAIKGSYVHKTLEGGLKERGSGDAELSCKWNLIPQTEASSFPSIAVTLTGIIPSRDEQLGYSAVRHWGAAVGLAAGREILWGEHVIGVYADARIVVHDLSTDEARDRYEMINGGLLLPISKYGNLQMLIEYNLVKDVDRITPQGGDYSAMTYGLRLVTERFNLTIGTQFMHKRVTGFEHANKIIAITSMKF